MATISPLEVFAGLAAALPATIFLSMVVRVLGNFRCLFIFQGFQSVRILFLGFAFYLYSFGSWVCPILIVLVISLGSCSMFLSCLQSYRQIYLSSFLGRESNKELWIILATQLIKAQARQEGRASLYNWQSINEDLKLEKGKEKKGSVAQSLI